MEALWKLEEEVKLTMGEAIVILVCTASAVAVVCAFAVLKKNSRGKQIADAEWTEPATVSTTLSSCKWTTLKTKLMGSFCWSSATRWDEEMMQQPQPHKTLLVGEDKSQNAAAPVWQRPILMGEKCELPRFSGLVLYDERGRLLRDTQQEKQSSLIRTTLRDLL